MTAPHEIAPQDLPTICEKQAQKIVELEAKLHWYEEQFRLAQHRQFGASSERTPAEQQELIFNEAELVAVPTAHEPTLETITYTRKSKGQREARLKELPMDTIEYRLPAEEQICAECGGALHELTEMDEVRQELKIVPAQVTLIKHVRVKYGCRHCERHEAKTPVITTPMPTPAFPNSLASASAVAYIMSQKFVEGLPLYRQEQSLARLGVKIPRQTLANWMLKGADWLEPLYDLLHEKLLQQDILHADETTLQVLHEAGRAAQTTSYLWLYRNGRDGPSIVLYDYQETRAREHPRAFLLGFSGYLHVDGYQAYEKLPGITLVGCWAHARRGFTDALKALPPSARTKGIPTAADEGLAFCNKLFAIERELHDVTPAKRFIGRLQQSRPVLNAFRFWLDRQSSAVLPKSALGQAIGYCLNQWEKLIVFLQDGRLELDNNRSERSIKPLVIGRKNWLFANTPAGAKASAIIYSMVETAKENGLHPYAYLTYLFEQLPDCTTNDLEKLLPWSATLPEKCLLPNSSNK